MALKHKDLRPHRLHVFLPTTLRALRSAQPVDSKSPQSAQRTQRKQSYEPILHDLTVKPRTTPEDSPRWGLPDLRALCALCGKDRLSFAA